MTIEVGNLAMIPIESITIGDRTRQEMGDLDGLEANMKESGLIQPLAVKNNRDGTYILLAGERRYTVLKRNQVELVPVRMYDENLSDLEMKVIEKSENFYRKDMEYHEFDRLTLEIHQMQQELHGVAPSGPGESGWGTRDTAEMLGAKSNATVTEAIKRAQAREAFPELFEGCKSASDASKVLKKVDEAIVKQAIAQKLESNKADSSLHDLSKRFIIKDFFEGVKEIPDGVMHLVEIDPPYGIDLTKQKRKDGESQYSLNDYNEVDEHTYPGFLYNTFKECYRVMAQHSWLICWFAPEPWFSAVHEALCVTGFSTTRMCGIWTKGTPGQNMNPSTRLANSYEMFFYAWKGQPALNKAGHGNQFHFSPVSAQSKTHPTERPIELMKELYDTFAFAGSRVLIPFLGSGNGIFASSELGMSAIGFELSKGYKDIFIVKAHLTHKGGV
ncbi:ParB N-terminal domain-containing protein [Candidatus Bathyarchaeota archaeon]|nr:ParB N-terminal domain-containing protein [Candidatus Bathyarchaeota archaeon]